MYEFWNSSEEFDRIRGIAYRAARRILSNDTEAEDVAAATIERLYERRDQPIENLDAYTAKIATNAAIDVSRRLVRQPRAAGDPAEDHDVPFVRDIADVVIERAVIRHLIKKLPPAERRALVGTTILNLDIKTLAERCGTKVETVLSQIASARRRGRGFLDPGPDNTWEV